jgi:hypothetical protein
LGVLLALEEVKTQAQRLDVFDHSLKRLAVAFGALLFVGVPVTANERQPVWLIGIGPPVHAVADVVVFVAAGRDAVVVSYGVRSTGEAVISFPANALGGLA